jgi:PST family polysaccharide transporter
MSSEPVDYFSSRQDLADMRSRSVRAAGLSFAFHSSSTVIQTGGLIILARLLGPEEFGLVEMVTVVAFLLQTFSVDGFSEAIIQKDTLTRSEVNTFFWMNVGVWVVLTLPLLLAGPLIASFYNEPRVTPIAVALSLSVVAAGIGAQHTALLKRSFQFYEASLSEFLGAVLSVVLSLVMAFAGAGYWSLVARRVAQPAISSAAAWVWCHWRPSWPSFSAEARGLSRFALNIWGNVSLHFFRENIDRIVIGRYFGPEALGHYGRAFHFSRMLSSQIANPLSYVALSVLSALANDAARFRRYFSRILETMAFVSILAACLLTIVGPALLILLLGPQWARASTMFAAFGPGAGIEVLYRTHGWLHMSLGRPDRWWQWSIGAAVVTVLSYLGALYWGPEAVAIAYSVSIHILILPGLWFAGRPMDLSLGFILKPIWRYWLSGVVTCLVIYGLGHATWGGGSSDTTLLELVWVSAECVLMYAACVVVLHGGIAPFTSLIDVVADLRRRRTQKQETEAAPAT